MTETAPAPSSGGRTTRPSHVVCVGASAGGVEALRALVETLSDDLDAAVLIVLHLSATSPGLLAQILARHARLTVRAAEDLAPLERGTVLVAPPDSHRVVHRDHVRVTRGPRENGHRPSIDVLFRSAAVTWGPAAIAVVLTGALDDGAAGSLAVVAAGGAVVVQDPDEATVRDMPVHALRRVPDARVAPLRDMAALFEELSARVPPTNGDRPVLPEFARTEAALATVGIGSGGTSWPGDALAVGLSCPDCDGSLFAVPDDPDRVRCRVGHGWTYTSLEAQHANELEAALWLASRIIADDLAIQDRLADRARERGRTWALQRIEGRRREAEHFLSILESMLKRLSDPVHSDGAEQNDERG